MALAKKKRAAKQQIVAETFVFRIETIFPDYSFTIGHERFGDGDYAEHRRSGEGAAWHALAV